MIKLPFTRRPQSSDDSGASVPTLYLDYPNAASSTVPRHVRSRNTRRGSGARRDQRRGVHGARAPFTAAASLRLDPYIRCSVIRMLNALDVMRAAGVGSGRILDYGAYFGNMARLCGLAGYHVTAADGYREHGTVFDGCRREMLAAGIQILDFADVGADLSGIAAESFDGVLALGALEHVPHTPRVLLESLDRLLRPGGVLVLDTPNLAYLYTRERLARGETIFTPIEQQYTKELPFEGHHREYTLREVRWMLERIRHRIAEVRTFNYSLHALGTLTGDDVERFGKMEDPELREIILSASIKPASA